MNIQTAIVSIIILAALFYVGQLMWRKAKSFSPKGACGSNCGCGTNAKTSKI